MSFLLLSHIDSNYIFKERLNLWLFYLKKLLKCLKHLKNWTALCFDLFIYFSWAWSGNLCIPFIRDCNHSDNLSFKSLTLTLYSSSQTTKKKLKLIFFLSWKTRMYNFRRQQSHNFFLIMYVLLWEEVLKE